MVLSGTHPSIKSKGPKLTNHAKMMMTSIYPPDDVTSTASMKCDESETCKHCLAYTVCVHLTQTQLPDFIEAEDLGVRPQKTCSRCRTCPDCDYRGTELSLEEREVVEKQESLMHLNVEKQCIELQYAWTEDVLKLTDNKAQAIAFQRSVEKKLRKSGDLDRYNTELKNQLEKGYLVELKSDDLLDYSGPISYVTHHPVYKLESKSTPV